MIYLLKKLSVWASLLGIAAVTYMVYSTTAQEEIPDPPLPPPIKASAQAIAASGLVESWEENVRLSLPVAGVVQEVFVKVSDRVEKETPLLRLDDRDLQAQLKVQEADAKVQEALLARAYHQHQRTESLQLTQSVSEEEVQNRRDEWTIQKARLETSQAMVEQTRTLLDRLTLKAPRAGTLLQVNTRPGEYLMPGNTAPAFLFGPIDSLQVRAEVDEQIAPRIQPNSKAVAYVKGDTTRPIPLEFVRIEPYITPKRNLTGSSEERVDTRVLQIIFKISNPASFPIYVGQQMDIFIEN